MPYPVNDRRGIKTFKLELVRDSLLNPPNALDIFTDVEMEFSEIPERVLVSKSAVYNDVSIPGRSEPWKTYSHSNPTTITFTAKLVAQGAALSGSVGLAAAAAVTTLAFAGLSAVGFPTSINVDVGDNTFLRTAAARAEAAKAIPLILIEVQRRADWLLALTFSQSDDQGRVFPPPLVNLIHGANFSMRGVITDVQLSYQGPWEPNTILSQVVEATLTFHEVNLIPKNYLEVRNGWNPIVGGGLDRFKPSAGDIVGASRSLLGF
jgi:hypothetical protein